MKRGAISIFDIFKKTIREVIAAIYVYTGLHYFLLKLLDKKKVTIVVYHDPTPDKFRAHLEYLSRNYCFISLNTLANAIQHKDWSGIPDNSLVVTIDDGHKGNHVLLDLFKYFRVTPTIYLCSHIVGTNRHFWWKNDAIDIPKLKKHPFHNMLDLLRDQAGFELEREYPDRQALNIFELREMSPFVDFGSHTKFHPILTNCNDEDCFHEIRDSKKFLEEILNRPMEHFVYPNGDYGERETNNLIKCGYKTGRTIDIGRNGVETNPYRLKAIPIEDYASINVLRAQLSGFFSYMKYLRYGSFRGLRPPVI